MAPPVCASQVLSEITLEVRMLSRMILVEATTTGQKLRDWSNG